MSLERGEEQKEDRVTHRRQAALIYTLHYICDIIDDAAKHRACEKSSAAGVSIVGQH